jgi:protein SCO1/2
MWAHNRSRRWPLGAAIASVALGVVACTPLGDQRARDDLSGWVMDTPIPKPALTLTDPEGQPFDLKAETDGYVTLLFFGYTNCPDVCPVHMASLGAVFKKLIPEVRNHIKVVFVTTDPERDTPESLRAWLDVFDRSFIGLRGPMEEINEALASMMLPGIAVMPSEHEGGPPLIGHPAAVLAFGRDGLARVRYPFGVRQADWLHDLPLLVLEP